MGTGRQGPNRLKSTLEQPQEAMPSLGTRLKIQQLQHLRAKINMARANYLVAPSPDLEFALTKLIREEKDLSYEVGFGDSPEVKNRLSTSVTSMTEHGEDHPVPAV